MKLHEAQRKVVKSKARFRVLLAGRRFGKTILAIEEMVFCAVTTSEARIAYCAPTYQAARDICWAQLKRRLHGIATNINESRLEIEVPNKHGTKSVIMLRSWDNVETLRGQYFHLLVLDEFAHYREFGIGWQEVLRPALTDYKGRAIFITTPLGFNHAYDLYNIVDDDYASFHFTSYDNPYLDPEELNKAKQELTEDRFAQEYLADFRRMEGIVFKEFDRNRHIIKDELDMDELNIVKVFGGVDAGYTNPAAAMTIWKSGMGKYVVADEYYKSGQTDAAIAEYVANLQWNECYPDPENAGLKEELRQRGVNVRDVNKAKVRGKSSIVRGIDIMRELFKSNRLYIHHSCKNFIWELEMYHYPEKRPNHNEEEVPVKENDHSCDAARYALMTESVAAATPVRQTRPEWISRKK